MSKRSTKKMPLNEALADKLSDRAMKDTSIRELAQVTGFSKSEIDRLIDTDEIRELAKRKFTKALMPLLGKAASALEEALEPGSRDRMRAVEIILSHYGILKPDEVIKEASGGITIIMPGAKSEKPAIEVKGDTHAENELPGPGSPQAI